MVEKSPDDSAVSATSDDGRVRLELGSTSYELTRADAARLRDQLADALDRSREFVHTTCRHRDDGAYVVERRGAESAGHRKVFDSLEECVRLFRRLPAEFTATEVGRSGLTGGRRHLLVWHFVEHPDFACELVSKQPLTARKRTVDRSDAASAPADGG